MASNGIGSASTLAGTKKSEQDTAIDVNPKIVVVHSLRIESLFLPANYFASQDNIINFVKVETVLDVSTIPFPPHRCTLVLALAIASLTGCAPSGTTTSGTPVESSTKKISRPADISSLEREVAALSSQHEKALELYRTFEIEHPNMTSMEVIAFNDGYVKLLLQSDKFAEAEKRSDDAIKNAERKYGPESTNAQAALATRLAVAEAGAQREKMVEIIDKLVTIADKSNNKHKQLRALNLWYSRISFACGEVIDEKRLQKLYELRQKSLNPQDLRLFQIRLSIAQNLTNAKKYDESEKWYEELLKDAKAANVNAEFLSDASEKYGKLLFQRGNEARAEQVWKQTLPLVQNNSNLVNKELDLLSDLGFLHFRKNQYAKAKPYYAMAVNKLEKEGVSTEGEELYLRYVTCLEKSGDKKEAEKVKAAVKVRQSKSARN
ncbi:MAG: hypothetical protein K2W95_02885 [Candidatus Obscuribacterales bacterium]|nr:hypothetical protein [Candidatus Obscuribacterales bacterium]